jgi:hypothetical protein
VDNGNKQSANALYRKTKLTVFRTTTETRICFLAFTRYSCIGVCVFLSSYPITWLLQVTDFSWFKIILAAHHDASTPHAFDLPENCYLFKVCIWRFLFFRITSMYYFHKYLARNLAFRLPSRCT